MNTDQWTKEERLAQLKYLIEEAKKINAWKERTIKTMLTVVAPKLPTNDYYLVKEFASVIAELNAPYQPCMNHLDKNLEQSIGWIVTKVKVEGIFKAIK